MNQYIDLEILSIKSILEILKIDWFRWNFQRSWIKEKRKEVIIHKLKNSINFKESFKEFGLLIALKNILIKKKIENLKLWIDEI